MALESKTMSDAILSVEHVSMKFGGLVAVNDLTFEARRGEITALIGPNGAGKTTVFNCITGFYKPTEGMMTLNRKNGEKFLLERMPDFEVNKYAKVARTFQNIRLFTGLTLLENLLVAQHNTLMKASGYTVLGMLGVPSYKQASKESVEKARGWLERIGLVDRADQPAGDLPYGAQRRLEIARAMCTEPELLCLDEPAAGLNPRESAELNDLLTAIPKETGTSILLIEHDMSVVMEISDHVVVLEYGTKISDGTPAEVQSDPKVIAAYLGVDEDEASLIVSGGPETIIEGFDGEPSPDSAPRHSASMMAGPIDQTVGHSAGGETLKVSPGASRAARVGNAKPKVPAVKPAAKQTAKANASTPAAIMSVPVKQAPKKTAAKAVAAKQVVKPTAVKAPTAAAKDVAKPAEAKASKVVAKPAGTKPASVKPAASTAKPVVAKSASTKTTASKDMLPKATIAKTATAKPKQAAKIAVAKTAIAKTAIAKPVAQKPKLKVAAKPVKAAVAVAPVKSPATKPVAPTAKKPTVVKAIVAKPAVVAKPDDLKLIKGIGPVNDKKLRGHGITTFAQIAAWKKADVIEAEKYLEFDGRIAREDWVGQAKLLAKGGKPKTGGAK